MLKITGKLSPFDSCWLSQMPSEMEGIPDVVVWEVESRFIQITVVPIGILMDSNVKSLMLEITGAGGKPGS